MSPSSTSSRLDLVDALRGFAIVSIMLLHNIEHFDLYHIPAGMPQWLVALDKAVWDTAFFLFGGKSYAIFALLFGVTFFIQLNNREQRGEDFRPRFAWRMLLLLACGLFNSVFYHGDILSIYAVLGLALIPVARMRSGLVLFIAAILILQPYQWLELFRAWLHSKEVLGDPASWAYFGRANDYLAHGTALQAWTGNLTNGKIGVLKWSWENGRIFQIPALFMLGMLAGRHAWFAPGVSNQLRWRKVWIFSIILFLILFILGNGIKDWGWEEAIQRPLSIVVTSWAKLGFMFFLVSSFYLLYQSGAGKRMLRVFIPLGRMSLTSYIVQSIIGTSIYYGYAGGMYQYTGATSCLFIGILLAVLQGKFSAWWLSRHTQGPLEALWHRATWIGSR